MTPMTPSEFVSLCWERCPSTFSGNSLLFILKLAALSKGITAEQVQAPCYMTTKRLARQLGTDVSTVQRTINTLKKHKSRILRVKENKGHASHYYLNPEVIAALPLADYKSHDVSQDAVDLANKLHTAVKDLPEFEYREQYGTEWPTAFQNILDRGSSKATAIKVASHALKNEWRADILKSGATVLDSLFEVIHADYIAKKGGKQ